MAQIITIESITQRYRNEVARNKKDTNIELEVRLRDVDFMLFSTIYEALIKNPDVIDKHISQIVGVISGSPGFQKALQPKNIREIYFENGVKTEEKFVQKEPLLFPLTVNIVGGTPYRVALSAESPYTKQFSSDESSVIRIKARVSFVFELIGTSELKRKMLWRVDMTIVRQLTGSDAKILLEIRDQMFKTAEKMTPDNILHVLELNVVAKQQLYKYEIEVEFLGPDENKDALRPTDIFSAAEIILKSANPDYLKDVALQNEIFKVAKYLITAPGYLERFRYELGLKALLPQVILLTKSEYREFYPPKGFYLGDKADGKRAIAMIRNGKAVILADMLYDKFTPIKSELTSLANAGDTILDGELVGTDDNIMFYIFDALFIAGENIMKDGFESRRMRFKDGADLLQAMGVPVSIKKFTCIESVNIDDLKTLFTSAFEGQHPYTIDGLIFVQPNKPYNETITYKWKPSSQNTIDMLAKKAPTSVLGRTPFIVKPGYTLYFLFVGISSDMYDSIGMQRCLGYSEIFDNNNIGANYFPIQFSPSDAILAYLYWHKESENIDGKVIELRCRGSCDAAGSCSTVAVDWELVKFRDDRRREMRTKNYYGNDFRIAELTWTNYIDSFTLDQLWNGPNNDYFIGTKDSMYKAQTAAISFVKSQRITTLKYANLVIDIGIGRGQDLGRYFDAEIRTLIGIDQDRAAISELNHRKYSFIKQKRTSGKKISTLIYLLITDINNPFDRTIANLAPTGFKSMSADAIVCNLAVHYFLNSVEAMRNFIALAQNIVKPGGQVILTIMNGDKVFNTLIKNQVAEGDSYDITEGTPSIKKYSIKRLFSSNTFEAAGQKIGVLLPFSGGKYYEENLVNISALKEEFKLKNFTQIVASSIDSYIPKFEQASFKMAKLLTMADKQYLSLHSEIVFKKDN